MSKTNKISFPTATLQKRLEKIFTNAKEQHAKILSEVIISNLEPTERGISQLVYGLLGIKPGTNITIGDVVQVPVINLPKWRWNIPEMMTQGLIKDNTVSCKVTGINLQKTANLHVVYMAIQDGANVTMTVTEEDFWVSDEDVVNVKLAPPRDIGDLL